MAQKANRHPPDTAIGPIFLGNLTHLFELPSFTIGREDSNQLSLAHPTVSRYHVRVDRTSQGHTVRDLGSSNGTYVNGQRVRTFVPLEPEDVIQIGPFKLIYNRTGFAQYSPDGNYRLDGISLTRSVSTVSPLSPRRWGSRTSDRTHKLDLERCHPVDLPTGVCSPGRREWCRKVYFDECPVRFRAAQGQVLINGDDLYGDFAAYRSILGYVPQQDIIHNQLTVESALGYAARLRLPDLTRREIKERIEHVLAQVELGPHKQKQIGRLSGGQRKRVSIAVELLAEPGLFFLDEPTSGLDPGLERKMMHTLRQLANDGRTILLVTHATANINLCNHVAFMADGRLAYFGPPDEVNSFFGSDDFAEIYNRLSHPLNTDENPVPPALLPRYKELVAAGNGRSPAPSEFWADCYRTSRPYQNYVAARIQSARSTHRTEAKATDTHPPSKWFQQFWTLTRRYFSLVTGDRLSLITPFGRDAFNWLIAIIDGSTS